MRKVLFIAALLASCCISFAQSFADKKGEWEIQFGVCPGSILDRIPHVNAEIGAYHSQSSGSADGKTVSVEDFGGTVYPTISLTSGYTFPNRVVGVFMNVFANYAESTLTGGPSTMYEKETIWHFVPEARIFYVNRDDMRVYGSLGAGLRWRHFSETLEGDRISENDFGITGHIAPLCFAFGGRFFIAFDMGVGIDWALMKFNLGYRF